MKQKLKNVDWPFVLFMGGLVVVSAVTLVVTARANYKHDKALADWLEDKPYSRNKWD